MAHNFAFHNPYRSLPVEDVLGALDELIGLAMDSEPAKGAEGMRINEGCCLEDVAMALMPEIVKLFARVVVSRGYEGTQLGVIEFMMGVREHSSDSEVRKRTARLAECLLPVEVVESAGATAQAWPASRDQEA